MKPAMTKQQAELSDSPRNPLSFYKEFAYGEGSMLGFLGFELATLLLSGLPGLAGFATRGFLYPSLFEKCGKRPAIGRGVIVRRPAQITVGNKVLIDDYACLDVRGPSGRILLGNHVSLGRFTTVCSKNALVHISDAVNIGSYCRVATQSSVTIGESSLIGAFTYIGPGNHQAAKEGEPLISREMDIKGGVVIGKHAWIGAHVTVMDGSSVGEGSIIGAHSLVRGHIPAGVVAAGVPAAVIRTL